MVERVILMHSDRGRAVDGIRDHSGRLAEELVRQSVEVELRLEPAGGLGDGLGSSRRSWRELHRLGSSTAVVLQYSPFCFAHWGFAPWLPAWMGAIRAAAERPALAVMVHEPYVPMDSWRWALMGLWQRLQLKALRYAADVTYTSIEPWAVEFAAQCPKRPVHHLPVGSNLPDRRSKREGERERLGADADAIVVACMGRDHQSWLGGYVIDAANAIAASGAPTALLSLGAEAPALAGLDPSISVHTPGYLEAGELAGLLSASGLFLAPLIDGVSTRRGSLMAALQHGLPVVGTYGELTDQILRDSDWALRLTPVGDRQRFASTAVRLAEDRTGRELSGAEARRLYEGNFDWPVVARELLTRLPKR